jgi:hypothetical protein
LLPFEKAFAGTRPSTDPEGDETKNRKYGTAIVEYGKVFIHDFASCLRYDFAERTYLGTLQRYCLHFGNYTV